MKRKQIWEQSIPIPTTVEQVTRERERQHNQSKEAHTIPDICPNCGCQVFDPFTGEKQIHDIDNCSYPYHDLTH